MKFFWKKVRFPCASACGILLVIVMAFIADSEISENTFKRWSILRFHRKENSYPNSRAKENSFTVLKDEPNTIRFSLSSSSRIKPNYAELIKSKDSKFTISNSTVVFMNLIFASTRKFLCTIDCR